MMLTRRLLLSALPILIPSRAFPHGYKRNTVEIVHPWTSDQKEPSGDLIVGMTLKNASRMEELLVGATSSMASKLELREEPGFRIITALPIPPNGSVELTRSGAHLRLLNLKKPLQTYDTIPVTLRFKRAGAVKVDVLVEERLQ